MMRIFAWGSRGSRATALLAVGGILAVTGLLPASAAPAPVDRVLAAVDETVGPVDPVAEALSFGVMTEGNANVVNDENEGTLAVGGDLTFGNYQLAGATAGSFVVPGDARPSALVVGGRVNFAGSVGGTRLQVLSSGYAKVGNLTGTVVRDTDNNGAQVNTRILPSDNYDAYPRVELVTRQPVPSVGPTSPINFTEAFAAFRDTTASLATCDNTVVLRTPNGDVLPRPIPPGSNAVVTLTPGVTNVLNLTATDLANIQILTFANQPTASTPLLVNVDTTGVGNTFDWTAPNFAGIGGQQARYVLFNFPTATALTLTPQAATVEGTIYAPNASLTDLSSSNTEGSVITRTLDHRGGEIHYFPFSTTLSCEGATPADISLIKSSTTTLITAVGQQVPYSFHVVNTGGVPLTNISVADTQTPPSSDANLGPITCAATSLAPGARTACTATYTVTQADLDNGGVTNTATARGTPPDGPPVVSDPDTLTIPAQVLTAALAVVKSSTTTSIGAVGQQVPYRYLVTNTGGLTLTTIAVTDVQTPPSSNANLGPITCPVTTLAPGEATACTATYTVTQADLDNNAVADTATAHGTPPNSETPVDSPPSTLTIPESGLVAAISVVKTSEVTTIGTVGQQVPYRFHVVNTGGLTLTNVTVTDVQTPPSSNANLGPITCAVTTLAPGETTACTATYTVTQADLDNDGVTDTATAHGTPPAGTPVDSPPSTLTIPQAGVVAGIEVIKSSTTVAITAAGQQVPYTFLVVNTGGLTLTGVTVNDTVLPPSPRAELGVITCGPQNIPNGQVTLEPGASIQCRATYTVTEEDFTGSSLRNVATATGTPPFGPPPVSPPSPLDIPIPHPAIAITKSATPTVVSAAGDVVTYRFEVRNTGNTPLTSVTVDETDFSGTGTPGTITCGTPPVANGSVTLLAGASTTCTSTYAVTAADIEAGRITNTAVAAGTPPTIPGQDPPSPVRSGPVTAEVTATRGAAITVVKSSSTSTIGRPGQQVPFQFVVTNTGQVTLTGVTITDTLTAPASEANLGPITCGPDRTPNGAVTLAAGAAVTCAATYTVSRADYHHGSVRNTATATGTPAEGPGPVSPESTITIPVKGKLPVTGESFPIGGWMAAGVLAVLLGAALLLVVRQRRLRA
jgi:choice-of-anchor A domain-containing protein/uncharacterized repeat protein (TIGR01451 family)